METDVERFTRKCFKIQDEPVLDNLNIVYTCSNSKLVLWNKYQIFVYGDTEFECLEKIFIPEFQIQLLIASNNYLLCLDKHGSVHMTSLKFKSSTQKTLKISFQPRDRDIEICIRYKEDHVLSLKYETESYFLCLHRINVDFKLEKKVMLICNNEHWSLARQSQETYLLTSHSINKEHYDNVNKIFKSEETFQSDHNLVVLSVDKLNVYACLFTPNNINNEIILVKLHSCCAEICNIEIVDFGEIYLLIGLTMGVILRLPLYDVSKTPDTAYLNTPLYRMLAIKNDLIFSDGTTMWKAETIFTEMKLTQYFVRNINDFAKCSDKIICTTFNKLIYTFSMDDQNVYVTIKTEEYCSAEKLFNNYSYMDKLFEEIDKNNELIKKLEREQHYITALSLSKRQDVINKAIKSSITVFETYEEAKTKESTLTEEIKEYFTPGTWMFLISLTNSSIYDSLDSIFSQLLENIKIYITLFTENKILKTTCIKMGEPLKTQNYLVPLEMAHETDIEANIKIVINIPGALDQKKSLVVLYRKDISLTPEYFIKTNQTTPTSLKKTQESIEEVVKKFTKAHYGAIFNFTDLTNLETKFEYNYYVKLPNEFEQIFKTQSKRPTPKVMQQLSADEFLKSKKDITFSIGNEKLKVKVHNDGISSPLLQVSSSNPKIALSLRNFFANVIYNDYEEYEPGKEFIGYSFYTTTENFQKAVKSCIKRSATLEEVLPLMDQFEKKIMGRLPL